MAQAQSEQSSVLQEELTCPVCLDLYRDPHLLPCGHNFCKNCLNRLKRQADRGRFRCPECRDSHRCGLNFQKNFKLANIADDYRQRRSAISAAAAALKSRESLSSLSVQQGKCPFAVPCDYCPSVAAEASGALGDTSSAASGSVDGMDKQGAAAVSMFAIKTCLKCEVSMCQEHVKPHLELPAFREHPLTEPMNDFWKWKCPDHDEIYRYYCMDDQMCVCNACTIEGGHTGHTIKTLKNTMKDLKQGTLDKQLYRVERKYSLAEKKLQEQKEKEAQNKKFLDDSEQCLTRLVDELKAKVLRFVTRLRECTRTHCDTNGPAIQKNISKICQDQARLQEVRCSLENLLQENEPFRFIEAYKTTGKQCRRKLRKNMFYPEYVDMETEVIHVMMEEEMRKFLAEELPFHIIAVINSLCHLSDLEEDEENEEEAAEDDDDDDDEDDDDDDSSVEEMRSEGEEEDEEEDEEEEVEEEDDNDDEEGHNQSGPYDLYIPDEEEVEEEEEEEDSDSEEEGEEEGVV